jgi:hypothetical protein
MFVIPTGRRINDNWVRVVFGGKLFMKAGTNVRV